MIKPLFPTGYTCTYIHVHSIDSQTLDWKYIYITINIYYGKCLTINMYLHVYTPAPCTAPLSHERAVTRLDLYIIRFCANERVYGYGGTHIYVPGMCLQFENLQKFCDEKQKQRRIRPWQNAYKHDKVFFKIQNNISACKCIYEIKAIPKVYMYKQILIIKSIISYVVLNYFSTSIKKIYSKNPRFNEKRVYMVVIYYVSDLICVSKIRKLPF